MLTQAMMCQGRNAALPATIATSSYVGYILKFHVLQRTCCHMPQQSTHHSLPRRLWKQGWLKNQSWMLQNKCWKLFVMAGTVVKLETGAEI
jgi:hypothetical protein